jgi:hypothetical protein
MSLPQSLITLTVKRCFFFIRGMVTFTYLKREVWDQQRVVALFRCTATHSKACEVVRFYQRLVGLHNFVVLFSYVLPRLPCVTLHVVQN